MRRVLSAALCAALIIGAVSAIPAGAAVVKDEAAQVVVQEEKSAALGAEVEFGEVFKADGLTFEVYKKGEAAVIGFDQTAYAKANSNYNSDHKLVIPASVKDAQGKEYPVTKLNLASYVLKDGKDFTSVFIPKTVKCIEEHCFEGLQSLEYVSLEENSELMEIKFEAFAQCSALKRIGIGDTDKLPDKTVLEQNSFGDCVSLESITLPKDMLEIPIDSFNKCSNLKSVVLPEKCETIGERAFWDCSALTSVSIPATVKIIDASAFSECSSLKSVVFETYGSGENESKSDLSELGEGAFFHCEILTSVRLPNSTNPNGYAIKPKCFSFSGLGSIRLPESVTSVESRAFEVTQLSQNADKTDNGVPFGVAFYNKNTVISGDIFFTETPTIAGYAGSTAEEFAKSRNLEFVTLDEFTPEPTPDPEPTPEPALKSEKDQMHDAFVNTVKGENEIYFIYDDFNSDGTYEAFAITGEDTKQGKFNNVVIYYINHDMTVTRANKETYYGNLAVYNGSNLLTAGTSKFIVWENNAFGSGATSYIYGTKNSEIYYQPKVSGQYSYIEQNGAVYDFASVSGGVNNTKKQRYTFDNTTKEFVLDGGTNVSSTPSTPSSTPSTPSSTPSNPSSTPSNTSSTPSNTSNSSNTTSPKTGSTTPIAGAAALAFLSSDVIAVLSKKKSENTED